MDVCDVGGGNVKEMYVLFTIKVLTKFAFTLFAISTYRSSSVFVRYRTTKREYSSLRTDPGLSAQAVSRRLLTAKTLLISSRI
jgi:uncharacterized membrane protein